MKTAQKKTKSKPTSLKFLYEIAAIPVATREQFLVKMLKRKNSELQKNVQLLKMIYALISESKMLEWDEEYICRFLKISKNTLYYHKSILLKNLRLLYFNWKEIEMNEYSDKSKFNSEFEFEFAKAKRMYGIGMKKEAMKIFKEIGKKISNKNKKSLSINLLYFDTLAHIKTDYFFKRELKAFNHYSYMLEKVGKNLIRKNYSLSSYINIELYINNSDRISFSGGQTTSIRHSIDYLKSALLEAEKIDNIEKQLYILHYLCRKCEMLNDNVNFGRFVNKGLKLSRINKFHEIYFALKTLSINYYVRRNKISSKKANFDLNNIRNKLSKDIFSADWKLQIFLSMISALEYLRTESNNISLRNEVICWGIIYNGINPTLRYLYATKFIHYLNNIKKVNIEIDNECKREYLIINNNPYYSVKLDNSISELLLYNTRMKNVFFKKAFYTIMLLNEFWKGKNCNYDYTNHLLRQINWINNTRPEIRNTDKNIIEIIQFGVNLMTNAKLLNKSELLNQYENVFEKFCNLLNKTNKENIITEYCMLAFLAEQSEHNKLKTIIKKLYWQIDEKDEDLFEPLKKLLKNSNQCELQGVLAA